MVRGGKQLIMKKLLILFLLFPVLSNAQIDTIVFRTSMGDIKQYVLADRGVFNTKQATLVSGTNIKTVNSNSLLGSGDIEITSAVSWGNVTGTLANQTDLQNSLNLKANLASPTFTGTPVVPGYLPNTATAGVANCPTASGTQTITHNLGRTPVIIDITAVGRFTSNAAATPTTFSNGGWTSSGNSCIYQTSAGTTTQDGLSSATFAVFIATSSGNTISGVIQNVGPTTFDIAWSETGTAAALPFRWKAQ